MRQQKKKSSPKKKGAKPETEPRDPEASGMELIWIPRKRNPREARSSLDEREVEESEHSDQDTEPQEIIHIDDDILDTPRTIVAKKIKEVYGANMEVTVGQGEFLLFMSQDDKDNELDNYEAFFAEQEDKYLNHFGPFTIISLFSLRGMLNSHLFKAMVERFLPNSAKGCSFYSNVLLFKARF